VGDVPVKGCDPMVVPRTREALRALTGRGPVIVGPWVSEIGFELLYWIPFLRWACAFAGLKPEDLWIVSRVGCRSWYADISPNYVDVLDFYSPPQFRSGNMRRMSEQATHYKELNLRHDRTSTKQHMATAFDRDILAHVARATGVSTENVLHPSMMYGLFRPYWTRTLPTLYAEMTKPRRLRSTSPAVDGLPKTYVAAKFYASAACPQSHQHHQMVNAIVRKVAETTDVVLLHSGTRYDDHGEFTIDPHKRVHRVALDPATNLETQTAIVAGAESYIGTYGGFAYLPAFLGVPTRTFYARPSFRRDHRNLMDDVSKTALRTRFSVELIGGGTASRKGYRRRAA
jgi:hypothetical protein